MEPGSCEDFHGGRQACWDGFLGKAVACVFLLEDSGAETLSCPPVMGSYARIHPKSRQPLWPCLLDKHSYTNARVCGSLLQTRRPRVRRSLRPVRAEVTREGGGDGEGGGAALWWDMINHFKAKGSKVPTNHPLEGREPASRGLLLCSQRVPSSRTTPWDLGRPDRIHCPGTPSPAWAAGRFSRAGQGSSAPTEDLR